VGSGVSQVRIGSRRAYISPDLHELQDWANSTLCCWVALASVPAECSASCSITIRTARARTSGENLFVVLLVIDPTFSRVRVSGKAGAVQPRAMISSILRDRLPSRRAKRGRSANLPDASSRSFFKPTKLRACKSPYRPRVTRFSSRSHVFDGRRIMGPRRQGVPICFTTSGFHPQVRGICPVFFGQLQHWRPLKSLRERAALSVTRAWRLSKTGGKGLRLRYTRWSMAGEG